MEIIYCLNSPFHEYWFRSLADVLEVVYKIVSILLFTNTGLDDTTKASVKSQPKGLNSPFHEYWFRCTDSETWVCGESVSILLFTNTGLDCG